MVALTGENRQPFQTTPNQKELAVWINSCANVARNDFRV